MKSAFSLRREAYKYVLNYKQVPNTDQIIDAFILPIAKGAIDAAVVFETFSEYLSNKEKIRIIEKLINHESKNFKELVNSIGVEHMLNLILKMIDMYDIKFNESLRTILKDKILNDIDDKKISDAIKHVIDAALSYSSEYKKYSKLSSEAISVIKQSLKFIIENANINNTQTQTNRKLKTLKDKLNTIGYKLAKSANTNYLLKMQHHLINKINTALTSKSKSIDLINNLLEILISHLNYYLKYERLFVNIDDYTESINDYNKSITIAKILLYNFYKHTDILRIKQHLKDNPLLMSKFIQMYIFDFVKIISKYVAPSIENIDKFDSIKLDVFLKLPEIIAGLIIKSIDNIIPITTIYHVALFIDEIRKLEIDNRVFEEGLITPEEFETFKTIIAKSTKNFIDIKIFPSSYIDINNIDPFILYKTSLCITNDAFLNSMAKIVDSDIIKELYKDEELKPYIDLLKIIVYIFKNHNKAPGLVNAGEFNILKILWRIYGGKKKNIVEDFLDEQYYSIMQEYANYKHDDTNKEKLAHLIKIFITRAVKIASLNYTFTDYIKFSPRLHFIILDEIKTYKNNINKLIKNMDNKPDIDSNIDKIISNYEKKVNKIPVKSILEQIGDSDYAVPVSLYAEILNNYNKKSLNRQLVKASLDLVRIGIKLSDLEHKLEGDVKLLVDYPELYFIQQELANSLNQFSQQEIEIFRILDKLRDIHTELFASELIKWYNIYATVDITTISQIITACLLLTNKNGCESCNELFEVLNIKTDTVNKQEISYLLEEALAIANDITNWYETYRTNVIPKVIENIKGYRMISTYENATCILWYDLIEYEMNWNFEKQSDLINKKLILKVVPFDGVKFGRTVDKIKNELIKEMNERL